MAFLLSSRALPFYLRKYGYLFSWKRAWNFALVLASLALSWLFRRPIVWGQPFLLMVEPTNLCNLKCPLCPSGNGQMTRARGQLTLEHFKILVDQVHERAFMVMLWNQGEPYLNPSFNEMVRYAHAHRLFTFTSTNGHFIRTREQAREIVRSGLDEIIFSVDGANQETYGRYRVGGRLEQVLEGIRLLVQAREELAASTPAIDLQFIAMRHNEAELSQAEQLARELKVDRFLVKTAQVYTPEEAAIFLPRQPRFSRYEAGENGPLTVKGQPKRGCKVLWYSSMINWDGTVTPCCFDKDAKFAMGQAFDGSSLGALWQGKAYGDFRRRILKDRRNVPLCTNCSEGYRGMFSLVRDLRGDPL